MIPAKLLPETKLLFKEEEFSRRYRGFTLILSASISEICGRKYQI
jgi:hypothetical protein